MAIFKFDDNDVFINTIEAYPEYSFVINNGNVFIDNRPNITGSFAPDNNTTILGAPAGFASLYETNINRPSGSSIRPFVVRDGMKNSFKIESKSQYNVTHLIGDTVYGSYNLSSSIAQYYYESGHDVAMRRIYDGKKTIAVVDQTEEIMYFSVKNVIEEYKFLSPHMKMITEAPLNVRNLSTTEVSLVTIPSLFYGQKIKPGTVELNYYVTGTLIGTLKDTKQNGELIQTYSTSSSPVDYSGSTAGIILYGEGLMFLTGAYQLGDDNSIDYSGSGGTTNKWTHFGSGLHQDVSSNTNIENATFELKYQGITEAPTVMMMCHANYGELNWSNNPTFLSSSERNDDFTLSNKRFIQQDVDIQNVTHTVLTDNDKPEFKRETYISKVAIYDEERNLIGVATLANPVRKTEDRQYTFKLKLDL
jgi:hypothetical protein